MYQTLKKVALSVVPKKILFENEVFFRSIFAFYLGGKNHQCSVCGKGIKKFIKIPEGDLLCPFCGSRSRTRRLYSFLIENDLIHGKILHFSPSRSVYRLLKKKKKRILNISALITKMNFLQIIVTTLHKFPWKNDFFDLIICYHILEHIEDDKKAMEELYRVLKPNGTCVIQTLFKEGEIYEDFSKKTERERLEAFGQEDHVRIYSVDGLRKRLNENGFRNVETKTFPKEERFGFMEETFLVAKK